MTKDFTKNFVDLSSWSFRPNRTTELSFNHREDSLYVRPLMVVSQEAIPIEVVEVPHLVPQAVKAMIPLIAFGEGLEWDIRRSPYVFRNVKVLFCGISLIRRDLVDGESLGSLIYQCGKLSTIRRFKRRSFYTGYDMSVYPAHQVSPNPRLLRAFFTILVVEPARIGGCGKARRINGKVRFYRFQGTGTLFNQPFQEWCQIWILQIIEGTVVVCGFGN